MGEQPTPVTFQGQQQPQAGQPAAAPQPAASQPEQPQGTATEPQYVTLEDANRIAKAAADEAFRKAQSLFDKGNGKVRERLNQFEQAMAGVQLPPEQREQLRQQVINQALSDPAAPESPAPAAPPAAQPTAQPGQEPPDAITAEAWKMMQEAGVTIEDEDPEVSSIDRSSPYKFLRSIEQAIEAKRQRIQPRTPTNAGGMGVHNPNPISDIRDPRELIAMGLNPSRR